MFQIHIPYGSFVLLELFLISNHTIMLKQNRFKENQNKEKIVPFLIPKHQSAPTKQKQNINIREIRNHKMNERTNKQTRKNLVTLFYHSKIFVQQNRFRVYSSLLIQFRSLNSLRLASRALRPPLSRQKQTHTHTHRDKRPKQKRSIRIETIECLL